KDERYLKVDGKPIFLIFSPSSIPDAKLFLELWTQLAQENGLKGIHFVGMHSGWSEDLDKTFEYGFDAVNSRGLWHAEAKAMGKFRKLVLHKIRQKFGGLILDKYSYEKVMRHYFT